MRKLFAAVCGTALIGASGIAMGQTTPSSGSMTDKPGTMTKPGMMTDKPSMMTDKPGAMHGSTAGKSMEFKMMDANTDGWVTREEYLAFYGSRYDGMKRNDKGYVSWSDMQTSDGRFYANNPTASGPAPKGGAGVPKATGGGSK